MRITGKLTARRRRLSVAEDNAFADALARARLLAGPRGQVPQAPAPHRKGDYPYEEVSVTDALRALRDEDEPAPAAPSFEPAEPDPSRETRPIPELALAARGPSLARPYVGSDPLSPATPASLAARPVIGDSLPALAPEPEPPAPPEPGSSPALFAGPGWAGHLMSLRVNNGEWDDVYEIAERGFGRNAADMHAGLRRNRARVSDGFAHQCAVIGCPRLAGDLLRRADEFTEADRAAQARGAA